MSQIVGLINTATSDSGNMTALAPDANAVVPNAMALLHVQSSHYLGDHKWLMIFFSICLSTVAVCGSFGNILIVLSVLTDKFLRQPGNVFIINLAIADFLVSFVVDPFNVVGAVYGAWFFNLHHWLCIMVGVVCTPSCDASLLNIMAVAVNRYVRICQFQHYNRIYTWRVSIAMCIATWIVALMIHFPNHVGWGNTGYDPDYYVCAFSIIEIGNAEFRGKTFPHPKTRHTYSYALFWLGCSIIVPTLVIGFCYYNIFTHVKMSHAAVASHTIAITAVGEHHKRNFAQQASVALHNSTMTSSTAKFATTQRANNNNIVRIAAREEDERKLIRSLFLVLVVFLVCWIPFLVLVTAGSPRWVPGWIYVLSILLAHGNSTANIFIYGLTNRHFRVAYKRLLLCQDWKSKNVKLRGNNRIAIITEANHNKTIVSKTHVFDT